LINPSIWYQVHKNPTIHLLDIKYGNYTLDTLNSNVILFQNRKVNNVSNVITIQKANTKSSAGQHGPMTNAKVGSAAMEEWASSADRSHPPGFEYF
jgi:hypothetical protein